MYLIEGIELRRKTDRSEVKASILLRFLRHSGNAPSPTQHPYACRVACAGRQEEEREGPAVLSLAQGPRGCSKESSWSFDFHGNEPFYLRIWGARLGMNSLFLILILRRWAKSSLLSCLKKKTQNQKLLPFAFLGGAW